MPRTSRFGKPEIVHATEARAIAKVRRYWRKYGVVLRRYYCSDCGGWHLATRKSKAAFNEELLNDWSQRVMGT
jgi:hypothetical protein